MIILVLRGRGKKFNDNDDKREHNTIKKKIKIKKAERMNNKVDENGYEIEKRKGMK